MPDNVSKSFYVPRSWWVAMAEAADRRGMSISKLVRRIVRAGAAHEGINIKPESRA